MRNKSRNRCGRCNFVHDFQRCPASGKTCHNCGKNNHFAACCLAGRQVAETQNCCISKNSNGGYSRQLSENDDFDILNVGVKSSQSQADWIVRASIAGGGQIMLKVDTGSQANLLPYSLYAKQHKAPELQANRAALRSYDGGLIKHFGVTRLRLKINGKEAYVDFFVVKNGRQPLLGLEASEVFGLVSRVCTVHARPSVADEFSRAFVGTGCVKRHYHMVLRDDAQPSVQPARRVPLALREPLRTELRRMEKAGIIQRVDEPTDWFVPGKELILADTLSRAPKATSNEDASDDVEIHATNILFDRVSLTTVKRLQEATAQDPVLQKHTTSSPRFPRSNGLAEKGVQIAKRILKKTTEGEEDFWLGVLNYRTTPLEDGRTPGELLMGRRLRSRVPDFSQTPGAQLRKHKQNDGGHCLRALRPGDIVRVASPTGWIVKAKVLRQVAPRSYDVISEDNRVFRRNRQHLKQTQESFCLHGDSDDDEDDEHPLYQAPEPTTLTSPPLPPPTSQTTASSYTNPHHGQVHGQQFRRSARRRHPPTRLSYDENFHQELVNSVSRGKMYRL
ncbi:unnamed protein product [Ixodes pacificus]